MRDFWRRPPNLQAQWRGCLINPKTIPPPECLGSSFEYAAQETSEQATDKDHETTDCFEHSNPKIRNQFATSFTKNRSEQKAQCGKRNEDWGEQVDQRLKCPSETQADLAN